MEVSETARDRFLKNLYNEEDLNKLKTNNVKKAEEEKTMNRCISELSLQSETSKIKRVQSLKSNIFFNKSMEELAPIPPCNQTLRQDLIEEEKENILAEETEKIMKEAYENEKKKGKFSKWGSQNNWNSLNTELLFNHENLEEKEK